MRYAAFDFQDYATPAIEKKLKSVQPSRLLPRILEACKVFWRNQLKSQGKNKRGWPSTGFWERAARSVTSRMVGDSAGELLADHIGLQQRWKGGFIGPVRAKAITIPISPVSYGHVASEFPGAFVIRTKKGAYIVQHGETISQRTGRTVKVTKAGGNASARRAATLNFLFKLSQGVDQPATHPNAVPSEEEIAEIALAEIARLN